MIFDLLARARGELPGFAPFMLARQTPLTTETFAYREAVKLLPDIYACVTRIQERISALPLVFFEDDQPLESGHPLVDLWHKANPRDTGMMLIQQIAGSLDMAGNAYLFLDRGKVKIPGSPVNELWCLPSLQVRPQPGPHRMASGYIFTREDGSEEMLEVENVVHFRRWDPDQGLVGLSPLSAAMMRALTQRDGQRWVRALMKNGGSVAGIYKGLRNFTDPEIKRIRSQMRERMGGPENTGLSVILPEGLEFVRQALTMAELQFIEISGMTSADIYRVYGMPPVVMGVKHGGGMSDAGATTDMLLLYENCIIPRCQLISATINEMMLGDNNPWGRNLRCEFDLSGVLPLQEQFLNQAKSLQAATGGPVITVNEARHQLKLPPLDDPAYDDLRTPAAPTGPGSAGSDPLKLPGEGRTRDAAARRDRFRVRTAAVHGHMERLAARRVTAMFQRQRRRALAAFDKIAAGPRQRMGPINVEDLLSSSEADVRLLRALIEAMVDEAGTFAVAEAAAALTFDLQSRAAAEFIERRSHLVSSTTLQTTWKELRAKLAAGVAAQESPAQLRARISGVFRDRIASDVAMIARTETTSAFNFGNFEAWGQLGPDYVAEKEWVTAADERVRDGAGTGHDEAEGQRVPIDQPFMVRGNGNSPFEALLFPGDPAGSAGNVINCRCVAMAIAPDGRTSAAPPRAVARVDERLAQWLAGRGSPAFMSAAADLDDLLAVPSRNGHGSG